MKYFYILIFLFCINQSNSSGIKCNFEEVYQDGSIQSGILLFNDSLLRYQYFDKQLYTIIYNKDYFVVKNDNQEIVNRIDKNEILDELSIIISNFPKIKNNYTKKDIKITIENSSDNNFIKRISINSPKINLSIYLIDCDFKDISTNHFQPFLLTNIN